jgi:hypothetical protein
VHRLHFKIVNFALLLLLLTRTSNAQINKDVHLNGYGGWGYGRTDGNRYQYGTEDGSANNVFFTLALSASPYENLNIIGQVNWEEYGYGLRTELHFAFAEWVFYDALKFRFGRVKQPFGIYAEVFNVGTIRPFLLLPQGIYGPQGFTAIAYNGIGMTGLFYVLRSWGLQYDVYVGNIENNFTVPGFFTDNPENILKGEVSMPYRSNDVLGGRLVITTPLPGFSFGVSGYTGKPEVQGVSHLGDAHQRNGVIGFQVEYLSHHWWLRAEYTTFELSNTVVSDGAYLELAYRLNRNWQLAGRYDWWDGELEPVEELPPVIDDLLSHRDIALGVNYWLNTSFVIKTAIHFVGGNRFAFPDDPTEIAEILSGKPIKTDTRLIQAGVQYSF